MLAPSMRPFASLLLVITLSACAPSGESTVDQCSNGRDDDGDRLVDCADLACSVYAFCSSADAGPRDAGPRDAAPRPDGATCARMIDLVLVLDVSGSMDAELALLRDQSEALVTELRALDPSVRISMVVFVDDALAVEACAPFADANALRDALEARRMDTSRNTSPGGTLNVDCPENSLDALTLAATTCPWREAAAHLVLHVTDDTFAERPAVLSGPFGGGVLVQSTYAETSAALNRAFVEVLALTRQGEGEDCGAGRSADVGQGFHTAYLGQTSLPERTSGIALDLDAWRGGSLDLVGEISRIAEDACQ